MQYAKRSQAIAAARALRASGQPCKVYHHGGVYCQHGRGLASYSYYVVKAV